MEKDITDSVTLKEIEWELFRALQRAFADLFRQVLEEIDQRLAEQRDKRRYALKAKRSITMQTMFGEVEITRNYYFDREKQRYTSLLDGFLAFEGAKGMSPLLEAAAIELAVTGSSYRQAAKALEHMVGYQALSHETIRQVMLEAKVDVHRPVDSFQRQVLFIEADGLYVSRQKSRRKAREEKILAIHQGWEAHGKRVKLVNKRHYVHQGEEDIWEGLERFLIEEYGYDPLNDLVVINGDGAPWITQCREYFGHRGYFQLDRFHVAKELRACCFGHPRWKVMKKKLAQFDEEGLLLELNSAVGTLGDEGKEALLATLIHRIESMPGCLSDYREWLRKKGIDTTGMRPMGSAESTMSVFAYRVKHRRSWSHRGLKAFLHVFIAVKDALPIRTRKGDQVSVGEPTERKQMIIRKAKSRARANVPETIRNNLPYLRWSSGTLMHEVLTGLRGL